METYDICMVGYGIATLSTLLILSNQEEQLRIIIFDPYFDGGNLRRRYGNVRSNTAWRQFIDAISPYCSDENLLQNLRRKFNLDGETCLEDLVNSFLKVCQHKIKNLPILRCDLVKTINEDSLNGGWIINNSVASKTVLLNYGAHPKSLNYAKPTLQLDAILNGNQLPCKRGDKVVIFGTLHSGVLCINRLLHEGINVVAVHKGYSPFIYERDGAYDGLKRGSAQIADYLIYSSVQFISLNDQEAVNRQLETCDWVIYACGFTRSSENITVTDSDNKIIDITNYDSETGKIAGKSNLYGFGIAYPNSNIIDGTKYYDVSLPAFIKHIGRNINNILNTVKTEK